VAAYQDQLQADGSLNDVDVEMDDPTASDDDPQPFVGDFFGDYCDDEFYWPDDEDDEDDLQVGQEHEQDLKDAPANEDGLDEESVDENNDEEYIDVHCMIHDFIDLSGIS
jgi:hypothetical protein